MWPKKCFQGPTVSWWLERIITSPNPPQLWNGVSQTSALALLHLSTTFDTTYYLVVIVFGLTYFLYKFSLALSNNSCGIMISMCSVFFSLLMHYISICLHYIYLFKYIFILNIYKYIYLLIKVFIYLFLERGKGREKERDRNIDWLPCTTPNGRPSLQLRHVPWLGIERATFRLTGQCSVHWVTPARDVRLFLKNIFPHLTYDMGNLV